ncbi:MAG: glycosyltransferase, partial [Alphaproteobacteria bacterium]
VVAYVGTVGPGKIHPDFVGLSLSADIPDARFVVCGGGGGELEIARRAAEAGAADRFELRGYVRDVGHVLSGADVFGYPLAADTYSSSDRALQEAMFAGVPPVILRHGGIVDMVIHEETGFVVDERDYGAALALLHGDPALRRRIGAAAARHARAAFDAETAAARAHAVFLAAAGEQPRGHPSASTVARPFAAARRFATALGSFGAAFVASLDGRAPEAGAADVTIAHTPAATARVEGGLFHHRNAAPQDGMLHYWSGLVLAAEGETAGAERELAAALEGGVATWRAAAWRGRIAAREGRAAAAIGHGAVALAAAPDADAAAWVARIIDPASNPLISVTP